MNIAFDQYRRHIVLQRVGIRFELQICTRTRSGMRFPHMHHRLQKTRLKWMTVDRTLRTNSDSRFCQSSVVSHSNERIFLGSHVPRTIIDAAPRIAAPIVPHRTHSGINKTYRSLDWNKKYANRCCYVGMSTKSSLTKRGGMVIAHATCTACFTLNQ